MRDIIPMTCAQREIMTEFYAVSPERVFLNKEARQGLWNAVRADAVSSAEMRVLEMKCPALHHQICRRDELGNNIQSAVFSECVYAQALAIVFKLTVFKNCFGDTSFIPDSVMRLLQSYSLTPRYAYVTADGRRMLIQAGGCGGVDSALITVFDLKVFTIEFKEPGAKTSEPDLPKYGEDGVLRMTEAFLSDYPQFGPMLKEQAGLNFFKVMGSNVNAFTPESIKVAITNNYNAKKFADVLCTEDEDAQLVMLPINHVSQWARIEGEIRPAGRNHYAVWTPKALLRFLKEMGADLRGECVSVRKSKMASAKPRGGKGVSRYKINPLFFVRSEKCKIDGGQISFSINDVRQLNPTIAGKMFFEGLDYAEVRNHYF